jgi:hypothetical protein
MSFYVDHDAPTGHQIVEVPERHSSRHFLPAGKSYDECVLELVDGGGVFCPPRSSPETIAQFTARLRAEAAARLAELTAPAPAG